LSDFIDQHLADPPWLINHKPYAMPDEAMVFESSQAAAQAIRESGSRILDSPGTRLLDGIEGSRFLVHEETFREQPAHYRVAWVSNSGMPDMGPESSLTLYFFDDVLSSPEEAFRLAREAARQVQPFHPVVDRAPAAVMDRGWVREHVGLAPVMEKQNAWALPDQALRFDSVDDLREVVAASENRFFDAATAARWETRVHPFLADDRFFITSTKANGGEAFAVRWAGRPPMDDHIALFRLDETLGSYAEAQALAREAAAAAPGELVPELDMRRAVRELSTEKLGVRQQAQAPPRPVNRPVR